MMWWILHLFQARKSFHLRRLNLVLKPDEACRNFRVFRSVLLLDSASHGYVLNYYILIKTSTLMFQQYNVALDKVDENCLVLVVTYLSNKPQSNWVAAGFLEMPKKKIVSPINRLNKIETFLILRRFAYTLTFGSQFFCCWGFDFAYVLCLMSRSKNTW